MSYFSFAMFCLRLTSLDQCCFYYTCFQTKSKEKTLCTRSGQLLRYKVFFTFIGFACAARDRSSQTYPVCDRLSEDDNRYFLLSRSHFLPEIRLTSQHLPRLAHNISMPGSPDRCCNILPSGSAHASSLPLPTCKIRGATAASKKCWSNGNSFSFPA